MPKIEIIVVGASAGGVEALSTFVKNLPSNMPAAVFVVLHFPQTSVSVLPQILNRCSSIPALNPQDMQKIEPNTIYVARPGCHMLVKKGHVRMIQGPKENGHRPAIDPLFRSAAENYGPAAAGVILSGTLDDGVIGLTHIKSKGGLALVQDPDDAAFPDMPRNALAHLEPDCIGTVAELARYIGEIACSDCDPDDPPDDPTHKPDPTEMDMEELRDLDKHAPPSAFTCPECSGTLFEFHENGLKFYRCRVGHSYTPEALEMDQSKQLEAALWEALRSLEENLALSKKLLERASEGHRKVGIRHYEQKVANVEKSVALLKNVLDQILSVTGESENASLK